MRYWSSDQLHLRRFTAQDDDKTPGMYDISNYCHRGRCQTLVSYETILAVRKTEPELLCEKCNNIVSSFLEDETALQQYKGEEGMWLLAQVKL